MNSPRFVVILYRPRGAPLPAPGDIGIPVAVRAPDGRLDWDPGFPRLKEAAPDVPDGEILRLGDLLEALDRSGLSPEGADPADLAAALRGAWDGGGELPTEDVARLSAVAWTGDGAASRVMLELAPLDRGDRADYLAALMVRLFRTASALRPGPGEPDPLNRAASARDPVELAAKTADQAGMASRALRNFARACRAAFPGSPLLNEDGLPRRPSDLSVLIARAASVESDAPALREAGRAFLSAIDFLATADSARLSEEFTQEARRAFEVQVNSAPALPCTRRATSPGAEALIGRRFPVLDRGEVELVDYAGTDAQLCRVARVSTGSERQDLGLLGYLVRHRHSSPLEFGQLVLRVRLPIFVDRQWRRHRAASLTEADCMYATTPDPPPSPGATSPTEEDAYGTYSERSMRYQPPLTSSYVPPPDFVQALPGASVKQGRGADLSADQAYFVRGVVEDAARAAASAYVTLSAPSDDMPRRDQRTPGDFPGVAPELARSVLPLGTYTEWYWRIDAWNLMHWLKLRLSPHAQKEVRAYAEVVLDIFSAWLPALASAFRAHVLAARTFSARELAALGVLLSASRAALLLEDGGSEAVSRVLDAAGLKGGERAEFEAKLRDILVSDFIADRASATA